MKPDDHSHIAEQAAEATNEEVSADQDAPDPDEGDLDDLDGELKHT